MKNVFKKILSIKIINALMIFEYKVLSVILPRKLLKPFHRLPVIKNITVYEEGFKPFYMKSDGRDTIAKEIYWDGLRSYESRTLNIIISIMKQSSVFFDIGANTGLFSLLASSTDNISKIYSFEPLDSAYNLFEENIKLNGFNRIKNNKTALSDFDGESVFNIYMGDSSIPLGSSLRNDVGDTSLYSEIKVKTEKLDTFVNANNIDSIDLMKIDTEGTEDKVLEGAINSIKKFRPVMFCEVLAHTKTEPGIHKIMDNMDYKYYYVNDSQMEQVENIIGDPFIVSNYLLMPSEKAELLLKGFKVIKIKEKVFKK